MKDCHNQRKLRHRITVVSKNIKRLCTVYNGNEMSMWSCTFFCLLFLKIERVLIGESQKELDDGDFVAQWDF